MISLSFPAMCEPASLLTVFSAILFSAEETVRKESLHIPLLPAICIGLSLLMAVADEVASLDGKIACDIAVAIPPLLLLPHRFDKLDAALMITVDVLLAAASLFAFLFGYKTEVSTVSSLIALGFICAIATAEIYRIRNASPEEPARLNFSGLFSDALYMLLTCGLVCFSLTTAASESLRPIFGLCLTAASCCIFGLAFTRCINSRPFVLLDKFEKQISASCCRNIKERVMTYDQKHIILAVVFKRIQQHFDDNMPFLDDNFTITALSEQLFTNKLYVSRAISEFSGMNFCQFVNTYRIRYSIDCVKRNPNLKVSELASMSGFKTQSSYNQAFRKYTGETPSDWVRRNFRKMGGTEEGVLQN